MFHPEFGLSLDYIHGDPTQSIEKCICMSVFHLFIDGHFVQHTVYYKYMQYLLLSVSSIQTNFPGWYVRIYLDDSVFSKQNAESELWKRAFAILKKYPRLQIVRVHFPNHYNETTRSHTGLLATMFRFLVLFDPKVKYCIFRDIDNIWTTHDLYFINEWIASGCDGMLYLDENYRKQEIQQLTPTDVIREGRDYISVFAGIWGFHTPNPLPVTLWHRMMFYAEQQSKFVYSSRYVQYKFYKVPFIYGFEELALSRILIPKLIEMNKSFYTIPIRIWNIDAFNQLFDERVLALHEAIGLHGDTRDLVRIIITDRYWDMTSHQSGLAQFLLTILTNLYQRIITDDTRFDVYTELLCDIYPIPFMMSLGMFVFKNFIKYTWEDAQLYIENVLFIDEYEIPWRRIIETG